MRELPRALQWSFPGKPGLVCFCRVPFKIRGLFYSSKVPWETRGPVCEWRIKGVCYGLHKYQVCYGRVSYENQGQAITIFSRVHILSPLRSSHLKWCCVS